MTITPTQFAVIAPDAPLSALHALVGDGDGVNSHLAQTLAAHDLTEPGVVAQFLAACHLASGGFVSFVAPQPLGGGRALFQSPEAWIEARARDWHEWKLTEWASEWDINYIADKWAERFEFARDYLQIWDKLQAVCNALGVEDQSEKFALDE